MCVCSRLWMHSNTLVRWRQMCCRTCCCVNAPIQINRNCNRTVSICSIERAFADMRCNGQAPTLVVGLRRCQCSQAPCIAVIRRVSACCWDDCVFAQSMLCVYSWNRRHVAVHCQSIARQQFVGPGVAHWTGKLQGWAGCWQWRCWCVCACSWNEWEAWPSLKIRRWRSWQQQAAGRCCAWKERRWSVSSRCAALPRSCATRCTANAWLLHCLSWWASNALPRSFAILM